jgi:HEAT repeat protein
MPASEQLKTLVDQMPAPDKRDMFNTDIDKEKIEAAIAEIWKGGKDNVLGLVDLLVEPGQGDDVKPHYALHALALHVCKLEDKEPRQVFAQTLASQLGGDRPKGVQAYLCQELGTAGGKEAVEALGKLLTDDELCDPAARALTAIREGAAEQFRAALPKAEGKCRLTIVQNLGVLCDEKALDALKQAADDADRDTRIAALWGLGNIGDPGSVALLIKAADAEPGWERIQNTKACLVLAEKLVAAGKQTEAARIYKHLRDTRTDRSEKYVRDLAEKALAGAR